MSIKKYDVIVIGAGPAGYVAAIRASQLDQKAAIIDKQWLGGVCLNVGCIPSKALLKNAHVAHTLRKGGREFGFSFDNLELDYGKAVQRSRRASSRLTRGVGLLLEKNGVEVFMGSARLISQDMVEVVDDEGGSQQLRGSNIVLATGAQPRLIPGVEVDGERVMTYLEAIRQEHLPESVVIIGSGAIGVEFATIWNAYGVDVTMVEMLPRLVPLEDKEISAELEKSFKRERIKVLTEHRVEGVKPTDDGVEVLVSYQEDVKKISAEQALVAIGFQPYTAGLGLEEIGVETTRGGAIAIDERMRTNVPGIWAIGDVTAKLMLAHVGSAQGMVCAEHIAGVDTVSLDYKMMPRATYCQPQIASFGYTPSEAEQGNIPYESGTFPFQANGKALGLGDYRGWVKILTHSETEEIIGAHMIGPEVTELLPELTLAQGSQLSIERVARNVHAHPTLSEAIMEAAHECTGHAIHI